MTWIGIMVSIVAVCAIFVTISPLVFDNRIKNLKEELKTNKEESQKIVDEAQLVTQQNNDLFKQIMQHAVTIKAGVLITNFENVKKYLNKANTTPYIAILKKNNEYREFWLYDYIDGYFLVFDEFPNFYDSSNVNISQFEIKNRINDQFVKELRLLNLGDYL